MNNKSSGWFSLLAIINFLAGLSLVVTLIFIPLAIYCFVCAKRYKEFAGYSDGQLSAIKDRVKVWTIFSCIVCFPIGVLALIPYFAIGDNGIKITTVGQEDSAKTEECQDFGKMECSEIDEKIQKLTEFKNEGIISDEEYERAVKELESKRN